MTGIASMLDERASTNAQRALAAYVADDFSDFWLFAGVALELAMKARLANENVALLTPASVFPAAVALWNARDDATKLPTGTMTIGGREALARVKEIEPAIGSKESGIREVLMYRNGEAHLGQVDATQHRRGHVPFLSGINSLLHATSESESEKFRGATL